jgi:hypothetical protein
MMNELWHFILLFFFILSKKGWCNGEDKEGERKRVV